MSFTHSDLTQHSCTTILLQDFSKETEPLYIREWLSCKLSCSQFSSHQYIPFSNAFHHVRSFSLNNHEEHEATPSTLHHQQETIQNNHDLELFDPTPTHIAISHECNCLLIGTCSLDHIQIFDLDTKRYVSNFSVQAQQDVVCFTVNSEKIEYGNNEEDSRKTISNDRWEDALYCANSSGLVLKYRLRDCVKYSKQQQQPQLQFDDLELIPFLKWYSEPPRFRYPGSMCVMKRNLEIPARSSRKSTKCESQGQLLITDMEFDYILILRTSNGEILGKIRVDYVSRDALSSPFAMAVFYNGFEENFEMYNFAPFRLLVTEQSNHCLTILECRNPCLPMDSFVSERTLQCNIWKVIQKFTKYSHTPEPHNLSSRSTQQVEPTELLTTLDTNFCNPQGILYDPYSQHVLVCHDDSIVVLDLKQTLISNNRQVLALTKTVFSNNSKSSIPFALVRPFGLCLNSKTGELYVTDHNGVHIFL
ncbi:hypothetical protein C9374_013508 [Naegleria lovaniensis]|uniref:Uncharacterized protein n=1 Tax=Naegleria lovaniensis TaxID=51637 RepID=A0AA88GZG3_NAELO|nr:uncharacterized protein C9374_013508 [Naegleria lovaniensis]KAG2392023.1 hypothetical protein C9374_013508 [Naegleria lovaniensis]